MIDIAEGPGRDLKNIRQIGTPAEGDRIYIENAAYARLRSVLPFLYRNLLPRSSGLPC